MHDIKISSRLHRPEEGKSLSMPTCNQSLRSKEPWHPPWCQIVRLILFSRNSYTKSKNIWMREGWKRLGCLVALNSLGTTGSLVNDKSKYAFQGSQWVALISRLRHIVRLGCGDHIQVRKLRMLDIVTISNSNCGYPTNICTSIKFANLPYSRLSGDSYEADKSLF